MLGRQLGSWAGNIQSLLPPTGATCRPPTITLATAARVATLAGLQHLDMSGAALGTAGCRLLAGLDRLRRLQLAGCAVDDLG